MTPSTFLSTIKSFPHHTMIMEALLLTIKPTSLADLAFLLGVLNPLDIRCQCSSNSSVVGVWPLLSSLQLKGPPPSWNINASKWLFSTFKSAPTQNRSLLHPRSRFCVSLSGSQWMAAAKSTLCLYGTSLENRRARTPYPLVYLVAVGSSTL